MSGDAAPILLANKKTISQSEKFVLLHTDDGSYCLQSLVNHLFVRMPKNKNGPVTAHVIKPYVEPFKTVTRFFIDEIAEK